MHALPIAAFRPSLELGHGVERRRKLREQALRVHAFEMRATRILRAEEAAHKIPVKMAFPLMFGLIPVVMIVTLTPAIFRIVEFVIPILGRTGIPGG